MPRGTKLFRGLRPDFNVSQLQDDAGRVLSRLAASPLSEGVFLTDVALSSGNNAVPHKLGRKPQGAVVTSWSGAFGTTSITASSDPTPAKVRQVVHTTFSNPGSTTAITFPKAPLDGSTILVCYGGARPGTSSMTGPSMTGATFTAVTSEENGANGLRFFVYYAENVSSAGTTITFSKTASTFYGGIIAIELTGVVAASADQNSVSGGTMATPSGTVSEYQLGSITPAQTDTFFVGFILEHRPTTECGAAVPYYLPLQNLVSISTPRDAAVSGKTSNSLHAVAGYINDTTAVTLRWAPVEGSASTNGCLYAVMNFKADTTGGGGGTVTVPHGVRLVSKDSQFLNLNAVAAVTVDMWVF